MATQKRRLNISLSPLVDEALARVAERDKVPQATKAIELLQLALEIEEDAVWDRLASNRDQKQAKFIDHGKVWQ